MHLQLKRALPGRSDNLAQNSLQRNEQSILPANVSRGPIQHRSADTIRRSIANLSALLKLNNYSDLFHSTMVILALKRIHRQNGRAKKQTRPFARDSLEQLIAVTGQDLVGMRERVMLMLSYETMRRQTHICYFRFEDVKYWTQDEVGVWLRFSKSNQFGKGKFAPITLALAAVIENWRINMKIDRRFSEAQQNQALADYPPSPTTGYWSSLTAIKPKSAFWFRCITSG